MIIATGRNWNPCRLGPPVTASSRKGAWFPLAGDQSIRVVQPGVAGKIDSVLPGTSLRRGAGPLVGHPPNQLDSWVRLGINHTWHPQPDRGQIGRVDLEGHRYGDNVVALIELE